jgi:hypothetical protein
MRRAEREDGFDRGAALDEAARGGPGLEHAAGLHLVAPPPGFGQAQDEAALRQQLGRRGLVEAGELGHGGDPAAHPGVEGEVGGDHEEDEESEPARHPAEQGEGAREHGASLAALVLPLRRHVATRFAPTSRLRRTRARLRPRWRDRRGAPDLRQESEPVAGEAAGADEAGRSAARARRRNAMVAAHAAYLINSRRPIRDPGEVAGRARRLGRGAAIGSTASPSTPAPTSGAASTPLTAMPSRSTRPPPAAAPSNTRRSCRFTAGQGTVAPPRSSAQIRARAACRERLAFCPTPVMPPAGYELARSPSMAPAEVERCLRFGRRLHVNDLKGAV